MISHIVDDDVFGLAIVMPRYGARLTQRSSRMEALKLNSYSLGCEIELTKSLGNNVRVTPLSFLYSFGTIGKSIEFLHQ